MKIYVVVEEHHINNVKTLNVNTFVTLVEAQHHRDFVKTQAKTSFPLWQEIKVEGGFVLAKDINHNGGNYVECLIFEREIEIPILEFVKEQIRQVAETTYNKKFEELDKDTKEDMVNDIAYEIVNDEDEVWQELDSVILEKLSKEKVLQ